MILKLITELELKEHFITKHLLRHGMKLEDVEKLTYKQKLSALNKAKALEVDVSNGENKWF
jgi:hypothetical protein